MENQLLNDWQQAALYDELLRSAQTETEYKLFSMLKPAVHVDGDHYCVLYGDDLQSGLAGFGKTLYLAILDFNQRFYEQPVRLKIRVGQWFIADIIGPGIYEMVEHGVNSGEMYYALVRCKKLFMQGLKYQGHETCCHPVDFGQWNKFKIVK